MDRCRPHRTQLTRGATRCQDMLIEEVHRTPAWDVGQAPVEPSKPSPAVPIKQSVKAEFIVCLEDGKKLKMLKRHLMTAYGSDAGAISHAGARIHARRLSSIVAPKTTRRCVPVAGEEDRARTEVGRRRGAQAAGTEAQR